ncbi:MAG: DUF6044 family protein, partial [Bacteroidota bacterium]
MKFRIEYLFVGLFILLMSVGMRQLANSFYIIHDNLDSEVIFKTEPSQEGVFFSFSNKQSVNGLLGEIPRNSYTCSPFNLVSIIFYFFPASWALFILTALVRATAFFGMFLFLRQIASIENKAIMRNAVIGFLSLGFAFLPFYSIHGLAIAGLPFLMYFLMLLRLGKNPILCFSGILLYGLSSSFVLGGYAVLILLFAYSSYLFLIKQEAKWRFFLAVLFLMFGLILSDSGLFLQFLFDAQYVSHRSEWVLTGLNWKASFYAMMDLFINGQYHAPSEHLPLLLFSPFLFFLNWKSLDYKRWLLSTAVLLICIIFFYGLYKSVYFLNLRNGISFLKAFQLDRFYFLLPVVWVVFYFLISLSDIAWKQYISLVGAV